MLALTDSKRPSIRTTDHFYAVIAGVAVIVSALAFAPSLLWGPRQGSLTPAVAWHALFASGWLVLYLLQTLLVRSRRVRLHRQAGILGIALALGVVVSGYIVTVDMVRRGFDLSGDLTRLPGGAMGQTIFQFGNLVVFTILVALALLLRRRAEAHKRLMALAVIQTLMVAPIAHLVGHFGLPVLVLPLWGLTVLLAFVQHDWRRQRSVHPATAWGCGTLILLANVQALVIGPSEPWHHFVQWLAG